MKPSLRILGLILSCLLVVFIPTCAQEDDDRVGAYTLVRAELEVEGIILSLSPPEVKGTLNFSSDGNFTMRVTTNDGTESISGTWNSISLTTGAGETIPYSFDESTIEFTVNIEGINFKYVWQKS